MTTSEQYMPRIGRHTAAFCVAHTPPPGCSGAEERGGSRDEPKVGFMTQSEQEVPVAVERTGWEREMATAERLIGNQKIVMQECGLGKGHANTQEAVIWQFEESSIVPPYTCSVRISGMFWTPEEVTAFLREWKVNMDGTWESCSSPPKENDG